MSYIDDIASRANKMTADYATRNPFVIAKDLGIHVFFTKELTKLKGMYFIMKRNRYIYINDNLDARTKRIVCAHELGHDQLHRDLAKLGALQEFVLYDMSTRPEYEANVFAASLLLDENEMLSYIYDYNYDSEQIARVMGTDINLVALKAAQLTSKGYRLNPLESRADFLK